MTVRLVATDLDGTLLRSDGTASPATVAALAALTVPYVLVTGRPRRWLGALEGVVPDGGGAIVANGAQTVDLHDGAVLDVRPLAGVDARDCTEALRAALPTALFAVEYADDPPFATERGYPAVRPDPAAPALPLAEMLTRPILKLLCRSGSGAARRTADELYEVAAVVCAGLPVSLTHSSGTLGLLEIAAAGVDKASALERYAAALGITATDVLAFGDGFNDVSMLTWAGHGVAVANAHPATLAAADEVTATNDDDGVVRVLARLTAVGALPT